MSTTAPRRAISFVEAADDELTIFDRSRAGRRAFTPPPLDVPERPLDELIPADLRRPEPARLPKRRCPVWNIVVQNDRWFVHTRPRSTAK